jgi:hypothetical protein
MNCVLQEVIMPINSISSGSAPLRPEPSRGPQPNQRTEAPERPARPDQTRPASTVNREVPGLDAATQNRLARNNEPAEPRNTETNNARESQQLRSRAAEADAEKSTASIDRADQARDALKARFEDVSRPKPEPRFEERV